MLKRLERKRGKRKNKTVRKRNFKTTHCMRQGGCYQQIRPVYRETKCWGGGGGGAETFVFTIQLKGHRGRFHRTDGARNPTRYRRPGLLE